MDSRPLRCILGIHDWVPFARELDEDDDVASGVRCSRCQTFKETTTNRRGMVVIADE